MDNILYTFNKGKIIYLYTKFSSNTKCYNKEVSQKTLNPGKTWNLTIKAKKPGL